MKPFFHFKNSVILLIVGLTPALASAFVWDKETALEQIDKHRKAPLSIKVVSAEGKPLEGAKVTVEMLKNAFDFGAAISANGAFTPDGTRAVKEVYLQVFEDNFDAAVIENGLKWTKMVREDGNADLEMAQKTDQALAWLEERDIPVRGHCVLWPSWENMPEYLKNHEPRPEEIREIVDARIRHVLTQYRGRIVEWDLVNEPAHHRDLMNIFGEAELANWFFRARQIDPTIPYYINQWYALNGTYHLEYMRLINGLLDAGAPVSGIGLQGHLFVENFTTETGLNEIWFKLNQYARFGLPIKITEFDLNGDKGEELQAEALENALILFYSHPDVEGLMLWGFMQGNHWRWKEEAFFWRKDGTPKLAGEVWERWVLNEWRSSESRQSSRDGFCHFHIHKGLYQVEVISNGHKTRHLINLEDTMETVIVIPQS